MCVDIVVMCGQGVCMWPACVCVCLCGQGVCVCGQGVCVVKVLLWVWQRWSDQSVCMWQTCVCVCVLSRAQGVCWRGQGGCGGGHGVCVAEVLFCVWPVHVEALGTARRRHEPSRNARCCLLSGRAFQLLRDFSAFECVV